MGWRDIVDLGDITKARGTETMMHIWMNLFGLFGNAHFGFKVVRAVKKENGRLTSGAS